jgi:hypothetical protein
MGLPAMQTPKKMAGGGIIAFAEGDSVPPAEEKATSSIGDFFRSLMEPPEFLKGRIERAKDIDYAESQVPSPFTAVTPSERARRKEETARVLAGGKRPAESGSVPPAVKEDAKKDEGNKESPKIVRVPNRPSGIAGLPATTSAGPSSEESELRKQLLTGLGRRGPAQSEYMQNASRVARELETYKAPQLSAEERRKFIDEEFKRNQEYSKPHFDMMQKLIDEEKAANNAGKESEFYQMLGKMGGALMSSRGAFGPALGRAVGEGIDYSDKMDAARVAAERLRRQAQMDLLKARMADEKGDRQSALTALADHDRALKDAAKIEKDYQIGAMNVRKGAADLEAGDERNTERVLGQLAIADERAASRAKELALKQELAMAKYGAQLAGNSLKGLPTIAEHYKMEEAADSLFANPFQGRAAAYLSKVGPEGKNYIAKVQMMGMKPQEALKDPAVAAAVQKAKALYINDVLRSTNRVNASSSSIRDGNEFLASIPK